MTTRNERNDWVLLLPVYSFSVIKMKLLLGMHFKNSHNVTVNVVQVSSTGSIPASEGNGNGRNSQPGLQCRGVPSDEAETNGRAVKKKPSVWMCKAIKRSAKHKIWFIEITLFSLQLSNIRSTSTTKISSNWQLKVHQILNLHKIRRK